MNSSLRNGLLLVTAVGTMMFPGERVRAADNHVAVPEVEPVRYRMKHTRLE